MPDNGKDFLGIAGIQSPALAQARLQQMQAKVKSAAELQKFSASQQLGPGMKAQHSDQEIKKAATQFEALLLHQMVQSMWNTVPSNGLLSGSHEEDLYRDMMSEAISEQMAQSQSIGIRDEVMHEMKHNEKK